MVRRLDEMESPAGNYTLSSKLKDVKIEKPSVLGSTYKSTTDYDSCDNGSCDCNDSCYDSCDSCDCNACDSSD